TRPHSRGSPHPGSSTATAAVTEPLWGRLYAGQRSLPRHLGFVPTAVGRDEPGPTDEVRLTQARRPPQRLSQNPCGAGFMPASGGRLATSPSPPAPPAGTNPAPQPRFAPPRLIDRHSGCSTTAFPTPPD